MTTPTQMATMFCPSPKHRISAKGPRQTANKGGFTVADAVALYLAHLKADNRTPMAIANATYVINKHVLASDIAKARVAGLTKEKLTKWRDGIVAQAGDDPEKQRARMVTANRTWTILRAILNYAVREKKCEAGAWGDVAYKRVDRARERYLEIEEAQRLVEHCDDSLRPLVQAALQTGCRYGELAALEARDLDLRAGTIKIRRSKTGVARNVLLSDEGVALFRAISAGRNGSERLFTRADGEPWGPCNQTKPFRAACKRAGLGDDVLFHSLPAHLGEPCDHGRHAGDPGGTELGTLLSRPGAHCPNRGDLWSSVAELFQQCDA